MGLLTIGIVENDSRYLETTLATMHGMPEVGEVLNWETAEECWRDARHATVDLMLVDIGLRGMNGVDLACLLLQARPELAVLMLTALESDELIFKALKAGALGYILKSESGDLAESIRTIQNGGAVITPSIAVRVLGSFRPRNVHPNAEKLTARERQILEHVVNDYSPREIGRLLGTSESTVRVQIRSVYAKLQVNSRVGLMRAALRMGLLD